MILFDRSFIHILTNIIQYPYLPRPSPLPLQHPISFHQRCGRKRRPREPQTLTFAKLEARFFRNASCGSGPWSVSDLRVQQDPSANLAILKSCEAESAPSWEIEIFHLSTLWVHMIHQKHEKTISKKARNRGALWALVPTCSYIPDRAQLQNAPELLEVHPTLFFK